MEEKQIEKILKEALKHHHTNALPLEKLEKYLIEKHGYTKEQAENLWLEALKSGITEIAIDVTDEPQTIQCNHAKNEENTIIG